MHLMKYVTHTYVKNTKYNDYFLDFEHLDTFTISLLNMKHLNSASTLIISFIGENYDF